MTPPVSTTPAPADEFYADEAVPRPAADPRQERSFSLAGAVRHHWFLTLLPVVVLLAAGVVAGGKKAPTYSATATINVGKSDIATQATPGYLTAAEALASSYSRLVTSQNIAVPAARAVGESPGTALSQLSAVPIPTEPTFTITATGSSSAKATALANGAVAALQHYVNANATQQGGPAQLLTKYQAAQRLAVQLQQRAGSLQGRLNASRNGLGTTGPKVTQAQVTSAKVAAQIATLKAQGLSGQYLNLAQSGTAPSLSVLVSPTGATATNRTTNIEKFAIVGAVAGLVIGIAFAGLAEGVALGRRRRIAV
jgi:capsular polysaccharide biosynthesis protein